MYQLFAGFLFAWAVAGCSQSASEVSGEGSAKTKGAVFAVNQTDLCEVQQWQRDAVAASCKAGQKVVFLPNRWGNEQLPVIFAAVNCDLRYSVVMTNGGVTCIYNPIAQP